MGIFQLLHRLLPGRSYRGRSWPWPKPEKSPTAASPMPFLTLREYLDDYASPEHPGKSPGTPSKRSLEPHSQRRGPCRPVKGTWKRLTRGKEISVFDIIVTNFIIFFHIFPCKNVFSCILSRNTLILRYKSIEWGYDYGYEEKSSYAAAAGMIALSTLGTAVPAFAAPADFTDLVTEKQAAVNSAAAVVAFRCRSYQRQDRRKCL